MEPALIEPGRVSGSAKTEVGPRRWHWAVALGLSLLAVGLAARFSPAGPSPAAPAAGLTVEKDAVGIASGAPQWRFLKIGGAGEGALHWRDAVPPPIPLDQTRGSQLGAPRAGRV